MQLNAAITDDLLAGITVRQRAMLKLQLGCLPLTEGELAWILPEHRAETTTVKPRSLQEVGVLFGLTRERVRQINQRSLRKLGVFQDRESSA